MIIISARDYRHNYAAILDQIAFNGERVLICYKVGCRQMEPAALLLPIEDGMEGAKKNMRMQEFLDLCVELNEPVEMWKESQLRYLTEPNKQQAIDYDRYRKLKEMLGIR